MTKQQETSMDTSFDTLADALAKIGVMANPAEIHGMLCGRLSGGQQLDNKACISAIEELYDLDPNSLNDISNELLSLYEGSVQKLQDSGLGFNLLLPDDEYELGQRIDSLGQWCQGFLIGLGLSGLSSDTTLSNDTADALRDLAQIAQVDSHEFDTEENEVSFFELTEYVRMAALLMVSETKPAESDSAPTLH
jgi:uncharacterized protein YgfB (UPF0149 family)